ncbi:hypothetical protein GCM10007941_13340 [Amphritea balenae]|nr:hypothetical protein GCM10007941_13340 [Amphritea balenae]
MAEKNGNQALAEAFSNAAERKSFFFEPSSRLQLVEKLEHLNRFSDFLLLVIGPDGAGKSTLLQRLRDSEPDRTIRVCHIDGAVNTSLTAMLKALSEQLSPQIITDTDDQQILNGIYDFVQVMAAEHIQWIIIADNAELLDVGALKLLLQMLSDAQGLPLKPHLLMAGTDLLNSRLQQIEEFSLLEAQVHKLELQRFTAEEAHSYLAQRYSAAQSLTEKQLTAVYEASSGYPGSLNQQVEQFFRSGNVSRTRTEPGMPRNYLVGIATVMLLVLSVALWQFWPGTVATDNDRTQVQLQVPVEKESVVPADTAAPVDEVAIASTQANANTEAQTVVLNKPATYTPGQDSQLKQDAEVVISKPAVIAETTIATVEAAQPPIAPVVEQISVKESVVEKPVVEEIRVDAAAETKTQPTVATSTIAPATISAKESIATKAAPVSVASAPLSAAEKALLSWADTSYTLQMLGAGARQSAEKFINAQAQPQKFYLFQTEYKNKPWFVVVYGQYKDRAAAAAASKSLPSGLVRLKPWARSIQGIQADLAARK